jgi:hypothetical protein
VSRKPVQRRPMTFNEIRMARCLGRCRFVPATFDKRFGQDMGARSMALEPMISEAEARLLRAKVIRFRRQISNVIVLIAQRELADTTSPGTQV